jgi:hypothetical protein
MHRSSHLAELANKPRRQSGSSDSSFASTEPTSVGAFHVPTTEQITARNEYKHGDSVTLYKKGAGGFLHGGGDKLRSFRLEDGSIVYSDGEVPKGEIPGNSIFNFEQDNGVMFIHTVKGGKYRSYKLTGGDGSNGTFDKMSNLVKEAISTSDNTSLLAQKIGAEKRLQEELKRSDDQLKTEVKKVLQCKQSVTILTQEIKGRDTEIEELVKQRDSDFADMRTAGELLCKDYLMQIAKLRDDLEDARATIVARDDSRATAVRKMAVSSASLVRQHSATGIHVCN